MKQAKVKRLLTQLVRLRAANLHMEEQDAKIRVRLRKLQIAQERLRHRRVDNIKLLADVEVQLVLSAGLCTIISEDLSE